jgi:hypothetical protein
VLLLPGWHRRTCRLSATIKAHTSSSSHSCTECARPARRGPSTAARGARLPSTLTASAASTRERGRTELCCCQQQLLTYSFFVIFSRFLFSKSSLNYTTQYRMYMYVVRCNCFVRFLSDVNILSGFLVTIRHHLIIISYVKNAFM